MLRLPGANSGARAIAKRLSRGGARFGLVLTSAQGRFVSRSDIDAALDHITSRLRRDRPTAPLLVVYFAGHGISEGVGWNHFSLPGDFTYRGTISQLKIEPLIDATLHAASLVERLKRLKIPYLLILDTCYEGQPANFQSPVLSGQAIENLGSVASILRVMNEFRQTEPVLFSTKPGTVVSTVPDPTDPGSDPVGPLARRAMITLDSAMGTGTNLSIRNFVRSMTAKGLDSVTTPAVTAAEDAAWWSRPLVIGRGAVVGPVENRTGSALAAREACCVLPSVVATPTANALHGRVEISAATGEFVTGGKRVSAISPNNSILIDHASEGDVTITFDLAEGESWSISLSTPDGRRFIPSRYDQAVRHGFATPGHSGLSVTGDGRGCNEIRGFFTVTAVNYGPNNQLTRLAASLTQYCDDNPVPLTGNLDLRHSQ